MAAQEAITPGPPLWVRHESTICATLFTVLATVTGQLEVVVYNRTVRCATVLKFENYGEREQRHGEHDVLHFRMHLVGGEFGRGILASLVALVSS